MEMMLILNTVFPSQPQQVKGQTFRLTGKLLPKRKSSNSTIVEIVLYYGFGSFVTHQRKILLNRQDAMRNVTPLFGRYWGMQKMYELYHFSVNNTF